MKKLFLQDFLALLLTVTFICSKQLIGQSAYPNAGDARNAGSIPGSGISPGVRNDKHTPEFLPGKFHGQKSLAGYST